MTTRTTTLLRTALGLALALALAILSSFIQGEGPEFASYGNLCGPATNEGCYKPVLKGGFPLAYLFDMPGVSVERHLSFGEDTLHPVALVLDITIYWSAIMFVIWFANRRRASAKHNENHGKA